MIHRHRSCKKIFRDNSGYTMVELLITVIIGAALLAAVYSSYTVVSRQYRTITAMAEVQEAGIPAIRLVSRDLRMAGYMALDANLQSGFGSINNPIVVTDSGNACCDRLEIIYDINLTTRYRTTYYTQARTNPARNALYVDRENWNGLAWSAVTTQSLVADYIEDFQVVTGATNSLGAPTIADISMIFRNKNSIPRPARSYTRPTYNVGNFNLTANDSFHRDEFFSTVYIRNLNEVVY